MVEKEEDEKKRKSLDPFRKFGFGEFAEMDQMIEKMMKDFERMFNDPEMGSVMGRMMKDFERMLSNPDAFIKTKKPKVYGFSLKIGPDRKPVFQRFGDVQAPEKPAGEVREPFSDVIDKEKEINVIVELPGVEKDDIKIDSKEKEITVEVNKAGRKYFKQIELPGEVIAGKSKVNYRNGVLEIILPKKKLVTQK